MTVVVTTAKCIRSAYSAYIGVGSVAPIMITAKAYASKANAYRLLGNVSSTWLSAVKAGCLIPPTLVRGDRLLCADSGQRSHLELSVELRIAAIRGGQGADDAEDKRQRNRHDPRIGQREPGEVHARHHRGLRARHRGREDDQHDRR